MIKFASTATLASCGKKSAGTSCCSPKLQGRHFLEKDLVDAFVDESERLKSKVTSGQVSVFMSAELLRECVTPNHTHTPLKTISCNIRLKT